MTELSNSERVDRLRKLTGLEKDTHLAKKFGTYQNQIYRWKRNGFHGQANAVIDYLLSFISKQQQEINKLKRELKSFQK